MRWALALQIYNLKVEYIKGKAVMDLHRSRSCATLLQSLYDTFVHSFYHLSFLPAPIVAPHFLLLYVQNIDISFFDSI